MTPERKLDLLQRAIVTAGGPEQPQDMADELYVLSVANWLIQAAPAVVTTTSSSVSPDAGPACRCQVNTP